MAVEAVLVEDYFRIGRIAKSEHDKAVGNTTDDHNRLHEDDEYAAKTRFGSRIHLQVFRAFDLMDPVSV